MVVRVLLETGNTFIYTASEFNIMSVGNGTNRRSSKTDGSWSIVPWPWNAIENYGLFRESCNLPVSLVFINAWVSDGRWKGFNIMDPECLVLPILKYYVNITHKSIAVVMAYTRFQEEEESVRRTEMPLRDILVDCYVHAGGDIQTLTFLGIKEIENNPTRTCIEEEFRRQGKNVSRPGQVEIVPTMDSWEDHYRHNPFVRSSIKLANELDDEAGIEVHKVTFISASSDTDEQMIPVMHMVTEYGPKIAMSTMQSLTVCTAFVPSDKGAEDTTSLFNTSSKSSGIFNGGGNNKEDNTTRGPADCDPSLLSNVGDNQTDPTDLPGVEMNAAPRPAANKTMGRDFQKLLNAFPQGYEGVLVPDDGYCGLHAVVESFKAQYPHLGSKIPDLNKLKAVLDLDNPRVRLIWQVLQASKTTGDRWGILEADHAHDNKSWFLADHLGAVLNIFGESTGLDVVLGVAAPSSPAKVYDTNKTNDDTIVIWIYHNGTNHYSGMKRPESPTGRDGMTHGETQSQQTRHKEGKPTQDFGQEVMAKVVPEKVSIEIPTLPSSEFSRSKPPTTVPSVNQPLSDPSATIMTTPGRRVKYCRALMDDIERMRETLQTIITDLEKEITQFEKEIGFKL